PQCILVDCLTLWVTNLLMKEDDVFFSEQKTALLTAIRNSQCNLILVSNETGMGVIPMGAITRRFVDESGWLHQEIAAIVEQVTLSVAGLPHVLKSHTT
ncbi:MAG: bifunctional adenosylcobinamide kinase/adenosylcobinamide-phosphate guanylyltransferase, partial [Pseudomonadales bacterium]|nr:bifunctional adenosylcobinamide kinase/adenosylcobinamide-phosphate guanylyltransferase [Pseudomonadales bacterium]